MINAIIQWSPGVTLEQIEKAVIMKAYGFYRQNKTATANSLGISVRTLDNKFQQYDKDAEAEEQKENARIESQRAFLNRSRGNPSRGIIKPEIIQIPAAIKHTKLSSDEGSTLASSEANDSSAAGQSASAQHGAEIGEGLGVQSATETLAESGMSMHERGEVQEVLSRQVATGGKRKNR